MTSADAAKSAIEALNGKTIMDRNLAVSEAKPQQSKDRGFSNRGGGFGGQKRSGGGGYGGAGGGFGGGGGKRPERGNR
jgi:RNA recognition motif-containing protein